MPKGGISRKFSLQIIMDFSYMGTGTFMLNFVLVGSILFELRLFLYLDIVKDVCKKRQFLCERQCFCKTPCHVTFKHLNLQVLHVYECGREREGVHPISFAVFMMPE